MRQISKQAIKKVRAVRHDLTSHLCWMRTQAHAICALSVDDMCIICCCIAKIVCVWIGLCHHFNRHCIMLSLSSECPFHNNKSFVSVSFSPDDSSKSCSPCLCCYEGALDIVCGVSSTVSTSLSLVSLMRSRFFFRRGAGFFWFVKWLLDVSCVIWTRLVQYIWHTYDVITLILRPTEVRILNTGTVQTVARTWTIDGLGLTLDHTSSLTHAPTPTRRHTPASSFMITHHTSHTQLATSCHRHYCVLSIWQLYSLWSFWFHRKTIKFGKLLIKTITHLWHNYFHNDEGFFSNQNNSPIAYPRHCFWEESEQWQAREGWKSIAVCVHKARWMASFLSEPEAISQKGRRKAPSWPRVHLQRQPHCQWLPW